MKKFALGNVSKNSDSVFGPSENKNKVYEKI